MTIQRRAGFGGLLVFLTVLLPAAGCSRHPDRWAEVPGTGPKVAVSFPALYCLAKGVAGEHAQVLCLQPHEEPHNYSPSAADALSLKKANVLIVNGLGLDEKFLALRNSSGNDKLEVVNLGKLLRETDEHLLLHVHEEEGHEAHEGHHHEGEDDPHVWLGIDQAKEMVKLIADKLGKAAPEHKAHYEKNAEAYRQKLDELHAHGKKQFGDKQNKRIVAMHDSMRYFAKSFNLKVVESVMPQPGVPADIQKIKELVALCTDKTAPVRVITIEPQYGEKNAEPLIEQIRQELKKDKRLPDQAPKLAVFDTLETAVADHFGADLYLTKMRENIDNLAGALK